MKKKNKKFKQYEKLLRNDEDFDFGYLLELERFKLKRMVHSFETASVPHVGIEHTIRDLKMCVKLLDIVMEDDAVSKMYSEVYLKTQLFVIGEIDESGRTPLVRTDQDIPKFPVHVNTKNANRFWKNWGKNEKLDKLLLQDLRRTKALYLYNKIRNRCFKWWW